MGFAEASQHICDPDYWDDANYEVLAKSYLEERAKSIDMNLAVIPEATTFQDHGGADRAHR